MSVRRASPGSMFVATLPSSDDVLSVSPGDSFRMRCEASGSPAPLVQFLKDGSVVSSGVVSVGDNAQQLTVTDVTSRDAGEYQCSATSEGNRDSSSVSVVIVGKIF